jgi:hypothetical protein
MGGFNMTKLSKNIRDALIYATIIFVAFVYAVFVPLPAHAQVTWNYSFKPSGQALATYLGDVQINGVCTGCNPGSVQLNVPNTWTATQTFVGAPTTLATVIKSTGEPVTITGAAPAATQTFDLLTQSVQYFTTPATNNWTLNIRGDGTTAFTSVLGIGQAVTFVVMSAQGPTPFYNNVVQIDGTAVGVTMLWQGGAPTAGNASGTDVYTYTVIKTAGTPTYTVLASQVQFK